jgi:hypothetical protein
MLSKNKHRGFMRIIPIFEVGAVSTSNQPTNDSIEIVSDNAADTQEITIWGIDNSNVLQYVTVTLTGTTAKKSTLDPNWKTIYGAFLGDRFGNISTRATGTITIRKDTGDGAITTKTAGKLSTGMVFFETPGQDIVIENIIGKSWFNPLGVASTTGVSGQLDGRMSIEVTVPTTKKYISMISDSTGSTAQIYVLEV